MKKILAIVYLVGTFFSQSCFADYCVIQGGSCVMAQNGLPTGSSCYCQSVWGPLPGQVQSTRPNHTQQNPSLPSYCCTPAGRLGPYSNPGIPYGGQCVVATPTGPLVGQACN